ncbi:hypothetical protein DFN06_002685 [Clostridium beijerinckii]|nr:hypothetical protein [Clostridium beijerinckii]
MVKYILISLSSIDFYISEKGPKLENIQIK